MKSAESRTIGIATPKPTTMRVPPRSPMPKGRFSRFRRTQPSVSRTRMKANPIAAPPSITHQSVAIACCCGLAGWTVSWFPPQPASKGTPTSVSADNRAFRGAFTLAKSVPAGTRRNPENQRVQCGNRGAAASG